MIILSADGGTYENTYGAWLAFFQEVAEAPIGVPTPRVPDPWRPLVWYLGGGPATDGGFVYTRSEIEMSCAAEPVLVDALWRADMKWGGERRHQWDKAFTISTYSGFWRPEILAYLKQLRAWKPVKKNCVLVPCAADKPYPSPLHKAVRAIIPVDYEIIVVTSALGLAPESLWSIMPNYDAGLPYFQRAAEELDRHFMGEHYDHYVNIVDYTDMLQSTVRAHVSYFARNAPLPEWEPFTDYKPLMDKQYLDMLAGVFK